MTFRHKLLTSAGFLAISTFAAFGQTPAGAPAGHGPGVPAGATIPFDSVQSATQAPAQGRGRGPQGPGLTLTTPDFTDGSTIPDKYTAASQQPVSPELDWTNVPAGTVSFVLILHDPDTALQKKTDDVLHWMVFNIPGTSHQLSQGLESTAQLPDGTIQAKSLRGAPGYMAPAAPPAGPDHHYTFELFALDEKLDLAADATRQQVVDAMQGHILGKGVLVGRFHRPQPTAQPQ
jgi:Raf kinase inhibitor-like YbhB/YbcL family protein